MSEEKTVHLQEGYNPQAVAQAFGDILQKGYNGEPLAQAFAQLTQGGQTETALPSPPPASSTPPATETGSGQNG